MESTPRPPPNFSKKKNHNKITKQAHAFLGKRKKEPGKPHNFLLHSINFLSFAPIPLDSPLEMETLLISRCPKTNDKTIESFFNGHSGREIIDYTNDCDFMQYKTELLERSI